MLLGAKGERVHVDASVGVAGVVLEGLDDVEVRTLTLGEAVLSVKLELSGDDGVLTPAVHVEGGLSKHEGAGIGDEGALVGASLGGERHVGGGTIPGGGVGHVSIIGTSHLEETGSVDEASGTRGLLGSAERVDSVGKSIDGVRVVEGLGTKSAVEDSTGIEGRAVVNVGIGLNDPDKLLAGVVEVELDLVRGRAHRLIAGKLDLLDKIFVGVLRHFAPLISVEEDVVDIEGGSNKGLLVSLGHRLGASRDTGGKGLDSPEALTNGAEVKVDLDFVVLESDQRKSKTGVAAEPEKEGHVECGLRKGVAGSANLVGNRGGSAGTRDTGEVGVGDVGKLGGVTNHLVVTTLLLLGEGQLVPDVHPVTVLAIDALTTNLDLNLGDELLTDVVQPTGEDTVRAGGSHGLVDLGESHLEVCAVGKIAVTGDRAGHTATEIGLTGEGLLDGLHSEVGVASVRHLPEGNLGGSSKEHVLGAIGDELHKSTSHVLYYRIYLPKKKILRIIN